MTSLDRAVDNLRRTLKERTSIQVASGRAANSRLLVTQAEAVVRIYEDLQAAGDPFVTSRGGQDLFRIPPLPGGPGV